MLVSRLTRTARAAMATHPASPTTLMEEARPTFAPPAAAWVGGMTDGEAVR